MTSRAARPLRRAPAAKRDIRNILQDSRDRFGQDARQRYRALLEQAFAELVATDAPPGSRPLPELGEGYRAYHIRFARAGLYDGRVARPRHIIVYRIAQKELLVLRILHERQLPARHVGGDTADEL